MTLGLLLAFLFGLIVVVPAARQIAARYPRLPRDLTRMGWCVTALMLLVAPAFAAATITPVEPDNLRVFQRDPGATSFKIGQRRITLSGGALDYAFNGTYTGTPAGTPQIQVCSYSNDTACNTVIVSWTNCGTFSGGVFSCTGANGITVPQGDATTCGGAVCAFKVQMRDSGATGTVFEGSRNKWWVGMTIGLIGQSNHTYTYSCPGATGINNGCTINAPTANANTSGYDGTSWHAPVGYGEIAMMNAIVTGAGIPVGMCEAAVGGTTVEQWNPNGGGSAWNNAYSGGNSCAGSHFGLDSEMWGWDQGQANCCVTGNVHDKATYKTDLATVISGILTKTGRTSSQLVFVSNVLGNVGYVVAGGFPEATAANVDAIRQGQLETIRDYGAPVVAGDNTLDDVRDNGLGAFDVAHVLETNGIWYIRRGTREATAYLNWLNPGSFPNGAKGPEILSGHYAPGATKLKLPVTQHGGASLLTADGGSSGTGLCCFRVFVGGTPATISSTAFSGSEIDLTLSSALPTDSTAVTFDYGYGDLGNFDGTYKVAYDNQVPQGAGSDTLGFPLNPTLGTLTATQDGLTVSRPIAGIIP